jgi:hypothetical protein
MVCIDARKRQQQKGISCFEELPRVFPAELNPSQEAQTLFVKIDVNKIWS